MLQVDRTNIQRWTPMRKDHALTRALGECW
jgi:hypothetical protein